jgi:hypothetical protein
VWQGLSFERSHYALGQPGHDGSAWAEYASALVSREPLLLVLAVVGCVAVLSRRFRSETLVLSAYAGAYLVLIGSQKVSFDRNLLPVLPALALLAGFGVAVVAEHGARVRRTGLVMLAVGVTAMLGLSTVQLARLRPTLEKPARVAAQRWIEGRLSPRAPIVVEGYGPWLDPSVWTGVLAPFAAVDGPIPDDAPVVLTQEVDDRYLRDPVRYARKVSAYRDIRAKRCLAAHFGGGGRGIDILVPCPDPARG